MTSAETQIAGLVSTLATRFIHRTLTELPGMRAACARLCQRDEESLQCLKRWAHKVRGTAASLGLADVSARAGHIEDLLASAAAWSAEAVAENHLEAQLAGLEAQLTQRLAGVHRE